MSTIRIRRGIAAQWAAANPVLASGEPALDTTYKRTKMGDGITAWNNLPYSDQLAVSPAQDAQTPVGRALSKVGVIIPKGPGGAWDEIGVEGSKPFYDPALPGWVMVYIGYNASYTTALGLALSSDLQTWVRAAGTPFFTASGTPGAADEGSVTGGFMLWENGVYYLFYDGAVGTGFEPPGQKLMLATATALTGPWTRHGVIIQPSGSGWRSTQVWTGNIVKDAGTYYLFFNAADAGARESIGYATASSLLGPWTVDDVNSPMLQASLSYESLIVGDPSVYKVGHTWWMAYFAAYDGSGHASGAQAWTTEAEFPLGWRKAGQILTHGAAGTFDTQHAAKPHMLQAYGRLWCFYGAQDIPASVTPTIALATEPALPVQSLKTYVPTLTATVSNPTLGSGATAQGQYIRFASDLVYFEANITFGTGMTPGSGVWLLSLPFAATQTGQLAYGLADVKALLTDLSTDKEGEVGVRRYSNDLTKIFLTYQATSFAAKAAIGAGVPWVWAVGDSVSVAGWYRAEPI